MTHSVWSHLDDITKQPAKVSYKYLLARGRECLVTRLRKKCSFDMFTLYWLYYGSACCWKFLYKLLKSQPPENKRIFQFWVSVPLVLSCPVPSLTRHGHCYMSSLLEAEEEQIPLHLGPHQDETWGASEWSCHHQLIRMGLSCGGSPANKEH